MKRGTRQRGFILVMALVILALAGTILVAAAQMSYKIAAIGVYERERLQVQWGSVSCQAACLRAAEEMLKPETDAGPVVCARRSIKLGGMVFEMIVGDEQAKANANRLFSQTDERSLSAKLSRLQDGLVHQVPVRLMPNAGADANAGGMNMNAFSSLDQILAFDRPWQIAPLPPGLDSPGARITCWSDGKINFKRANPVVLREFLLAEGAVVDADKLLTLRANKPDCTLDDAASQLESPDIGTAARKVLTDSSQSHSVWIIVRGKTRSWYRMCVEQTAGGTAQDPIVFAW